jgi:hypothetical protein
MAKNIVQDVIPPEKKSIRNVTLPQRQSNQVVEQVTIHNHTESEEKIFEDTLRRSAPPRHDVSRYVMYVLAGASFIFLIIVLMLAFSKATLTITPRSTALDFNRPLVAEKSTTTGLSFEVITVGKSSSMEVEATGEQFVSRKASGIITIYNNFGSAPQRLIKNTRFETPDGLIFRIDSSVTVPGKTVKNGASVPGSVDVAIQADEAGVQYNIPPTTFTIPGFKNDPARFKGFSAQNKEPFKDGFLGNVKAVSPENEQKAIIALEEKLRQNLLKETMAVLPEGSILYPSAFFFATSSVPLTSGTGKNATLKLTATSTALVFSEKQLASAIARESISGYDGAPVEVRELSDLSFVLVQPYKKDSTTIAFTLRGSAKLVWSFDENELKEALVGKPKKATQSVLSAFPGITPTATVLIRPFFKTTYPGKPSRITIIEKII